MKKIKILIISVCLLILTGCWDSVDINKQSLITMIAVDKKDDNYRIILEKKPISKGASEGRTGVVPSQFFSVKEKILPKLLNHI